jgi:hypothetical protein
MPMLAGRIVAVPPVPPATSCNSSAPRNEVALIRVTTRDPFGSALAPVMPARTTVSPV